MDNNILQFLTDNGITSIDQLQSDQYGNLRIPGSGSMVGTVNDYPNIANILSTQAKANTPVAPVSTTPTTTTSPTLSSAENSAWLSQVLGNGLTRGEYQDVAKGLGYTGEFGAGGHAKYLEENSARKDALNQAVEQAKLALMNIINQWLLTHANFF